MAVWAVVFSGRSPWQGLREGCCQRGPAAAAAPTDDGTALIWCRRPAAPDGRQDCAFMESSYRQSSSGEERQ